VAQFISKLKKKDSKEEVIGIFGQIDEGGRYFLSLESDYAATAACVAAFVKLLYGRDTNDYGVFFPFELFHFEDVLRYIAPKIVNYEVTSSIR
jgi:hypothetical protein